MEHLMHLEDEPFEMIKGGRKRVELRLYDEKRRRIELGDIIVFRRMDESEEIRVRVKGLLRFASFRDLFEFVPGEFVGLGNLSIGEKIARMRRYYTEEEERKYGVLGIWFEIESKE